MNIVTQSSGLSQPAARQKDSLPSFAPDEHLPISATQLQCQGSSQLDESRPPHQQYQLPTPHEPLT